MIQLLTNQSIRKLLRDSGSNTKDKNLIDSNSNQYLRELH